MRLTLLLLTLALASGLRPDGTSQTALRAVAGITAGADRAPVALSGIGQPGPTEKGRPLAGPPLCIPGRIRPLT